MKLEIVTIDKTRKQLLKSRTRKQTVEVKNKFDDAGVEEFVTIASTEEDKFVGSVSEYAAQFTVIVNQKPWFSRCPSCSAAPGTSSTSPW